MTRYLNANDITKRITRLEQLGRDLAAEADEWKLCDDPLTPEERRQYLSDVLDTVTGLATARDVLAWVKIRLAREAKQRG
jgi:hypothetical protein